MSYFDATITDILSIDELHIVLFDFYGIELKMMGLKPPANISIGTKVKLGTKPTNITLAKNLQGTISCCNKLPSTVEQIEKGQLLTSILLKTNKTIFESIITTASFEKMEIKNNDQITALIKSSELFIQKVLDE